MTALERHGALVEIIRRIANKTLLNDHELEGDIVLDKDSLRSLVALDDEGLIIDLLVDNNPVKNIANYLPAAVNKTGFITLAFRPGSVHWSFDDFLENDDNRFREPNFFYLIEDDIDSRDDEQHDLLKRYRDVVKFIDLLAQLSDVPDGVRNPQSIFFSGAARREIPPVYTPSDVVALEKLDELRGILLTEVHREEKRGIFKAELLDILSPECDGDHLLPILLARYDVLRKNFIEAYNVYIQEFSAKKIINELESSNLDLANRLHSVLVDMNKSMFALPIALIFAATKFNQNVLALTINTIIILCSWLALGIFFLNLAAHKRTLAFVYAEILEQKEKAERYNDLRERLIPPYDRLLARCKFQKRLRISLGIALWLIFIVITSIYSYYTIPIFISALATNP